MTYFVLPSVTLKILQIFDCEVLDDAGGASLPRVRAHLDRGLQTSGAIAAADYSCPCMSPLVGLRRRDVLRADRQ